MSYDISISHYPFETEDNHWPKTELNWLRNPFGLCDFAEDNVGDGKHSLWHVCNDHAYDDVKNLDRADFLRVVLDYWDRLKNLEVGYFYFDLASYLQFSPEYPEAMKLPTIHWRLKHTKEECAQVYKWGPEQRTIGFNVHQFALYPSHFSFRGRGPLRHYKDWFKDLVDIARAMQDPEVTVRISN